MKSQLLITAFGRDGGAENSHWGREEAIWSGQ